MRVILIILACLFLISAASETTVKEVMARTVKLYVKSGDNGGG
jgi:hypothetical protein